MAFHNVSALSSSERDIAAQIFAEEISRFTCPSCGASIKSMKGLSRRSEVGMEGRRPVVRIVSRHRCGLCPFEGDLVVMIDRRKLIQH